MSVTKEFLEQSIRRLGENIPRIEKCLNELTEDEVWQRPNSSSNSVGNLILHLCGNITQYVISSLGGQPDNRKRDAEFSASGGYKKMELLEKITKTINHAAEVIKNTNEDELLRVRKVQVYDVSGVNIIIHVTEHLSYHTGQIVFWTKLLKDKDMGFYKGINLNKKNK